MSRSVIADARICELLEFDRILDQLQGYALSTDGSSMLSQQTFLNNPKEITVIDELVENYRALCEHGETHLTLQFPSLEHFFKKLYRQGSCLDPDELFAVATYVSSSYAWQHWAMSLLKNDKPLAELFNNMPAFADEARRITKLIDAQGNIIDDNAPSLKRIRSRLNTIQKQIRAVSMRYLRDPKLGKIWNADLPTQRDGRTVLIIKADYRGKLNGIAQGVSDSGASIYFEPKEIAGLNNEWRLEDDKYQRECLKLLRNLTFLLHQRVDELAVLRDIVARLDAIRSRARFAISYGCRSVAISDRAIHLPQARHPLLGEEAVPITVTIEAPHLGIIITGPNTGGKTLTLKTVGLFALMRQFGMQLPVEKGGCIPIFDYISADIGDEQSLSQSLSTFSSHVTRIAQMLQRANSKSLLMFDELGAGTDPSEGAALAMSILDRCAQLNAMTMVTTHHGLLKEYSYQSEKFNNASVEFDTIALTPTYHLFIGVPGESHALQIAQNVGIDSAIIRRARHYLNEHRSKGVQMLEQLIEQEARLRREAKELREEKSRLAAIDKEQCRRAIHLDKREQELKLAKLSDFDNWISQRRREIENETCRFREQQHQSERRDRQILANSAQARRLRKSDPQEDDSRSDGALEGTANSAQQSIRQVFTAATEQIKEHKAVALQTLQTSSSERLEPGMKVNISDSSRSGILIRATKRKHWLVEVGDVRIEMPAHLLRSIALSDQGIAGDNNSNDVSHAKLSNVTITHGKIEEPLRELDLRGLRLDEALSQARQQIDRAVAHGLRSFDIIHGYGEGILRDGIRQLLNDSVAISEFSYAPPQQGGFGKTIAYLV